MYFQTRSVASHASPSLIACYLVPTLCRLPCLTLRQASSPYHLVPTLCRLPFLTLDLLDFSPPCRVDSKRGIMEVCPHPRLGLGLMATTRLVKGDDCIYHGEVISKKDAVQRQQVGTPAVGGLPEFGCSWLPPPYDAKTGTPTVRLGRTLTSHRNLDCLLRLLQGYELAGMPVMFFTRSDGLVIDGLGYARPLLPLTLHSRLTLAPTLIASLRGSQGQSGSLRWELKPPTTRYPVLTLLSLLSLNLSGTAVRPAMPTTGR